MLSTPGSWQSVLDGRLRAFLEGQSEMIRGWADDETRVVFALVSAIDCLVARTAERMRQLLRERTGEDLPLGKT